MVEGRREAACVGRLDDAPVLLVAIGVPNQCVQNQLAGEYAPRHQSRTCRRQRTETIQCAVDRIERVLLPSRCRNPEHCATTHAIRSAQSSPFWYAGPLLGQLNVASFISQRRPSAGSAIHRFGFLPTSSGPS